MADPTCALVEAIREHNGESDARFGEKFHAGILFLVQRYCENDAETCCGAVVSSSIEAIRLGNISLDEQIPALVRRELNKLISRMVLPQGRPGQSFIADDDLSDLKTRFELFTPLQRQALVRFYLNREDAATICEDLSVTQEQFRVLRATARATFINSVGRKERVERRRFGLIKSFA